ncbi:pyridoxamine 5'-phosphate oxidase [alpha proteobacterium U9-1i]|nr:pyridoxamine 5'-phosphate oxidase [alpha proteobacterium U9-1i]
MAPPITQRSDQTISNLNALCALAKPDPLITSCWWSAPISAAAINTKSRFRETRDIRRFHVAHASAAAHVDGMNTYTPTPRTKPVRRAQRASYDKALVHAILDEALCGTLATIVDNEPFAQPMIHARDGDDIILHGSSANRMLSALEAGARACLSVSLIDGLLLGRTVPDHSFQYRSVSVHGTCRAITNASEKRARMRRVFDHIIAKRWETLPPVDEGYLGHVKVLILPLDECVAKINAGVPDDVPGDPAHAVWSGIVPLAVQAGVPRPAPGPQPQPPSEVARYTRT